MYVDTFAKDIRFKLPECNADIRWWDITEMTSMITIMEILALLDLAERTDKEVSLLDRMKDYCATALLCLCR